MKVKVVSISGFGGGYEATCQKMVRNGLKHVADNPKINPKYHGYTNVYGLCIGDNDDAKALSDAVCGGFSEREGPTGAMHQASITHLFYIMKHGYEGWLKKGRETDRIIEIECEDAEQLVSWET